MTPNDNILPHMDRVAESPLFKAVEAQDAEEVRRLLGSEKPGPVFSAISLAAGRGHTDIVKLFLDDGAVDIDIRDIYGRTCLAFGIAHPAVVEMLLERKADPELQGLDGASPLHLAIKGLHTESAILLLKYGADVDSENYENQRPIDIALLKTPRSTGSVMLIKALLEYGCDIGGSKMSMWRTALMATDADVLLVTKNNKWTILPEKEISGSATSAGKAPATFTPRITPRIGIEIVKEVPKHARFISANGSDAPVIRRRYFGPAKSLLFPKQFGRLAAAGSMVKWQWRKQVGTLQPSGIGLSAAERLLTTNDTDAFLSCFVSFQYITRVQGTKGWTSQDAVDNTFRTGSAFSQISWTMRKASIRGRDGNRSVPSTVSVFLSEDFRGTLEVGWIPDSGLDFFTLFIVDLHNKWRIIFDDADDHLRQNRTLLLRKKGRTTEFIDNLLFDAQQWSNFRSLLEMQIRKARDLAEDFEDNQCVREEVNMGIDRTLRLLGHDVAMLRKLLDAIERLEVEVKDEIKKLDARTKEMIELEFNLVSIFEARTSKIMGMSMKRLSWITFIFLPLMFIGTLFGMNVDAIAGGPHWWWVIVLGASLFVLVLIVWGILKIFRPEEFTGFEEETPISRFNMRNGHALGILSRRMMGRNRAVDMESADQPGPVQQFKSPGRQWSKLKDL